MQNPLKPFDRFWVQAIGWLTLWVVLCAYKDGEQCGHSKLDRVEAAKPSVQQAAGVSTPAGAWRCPAVTSTLPENSYRVASWALSSLANVQHEGAVGKHDPKKTSKVKPIDGAQAVEVLACVLAHRQADVIALQGIHASQYPLINKVLERLTSLVGGKWSSYFDKCEGKMRRHVGVIYRSDLVRFRQLEAIESLNPTLKMCDLGLYPGVSGYVEHNKGGSLYVVSFHLSRGTTSQQHAQRVASFLGLSHAQVKHMPIKDGDIVAMGVTNTDGCEDTVQGCLNPMDTRAETALIDQVLGKMTPPFAATWASAEGAPVSKLFPRRVDAVLVSKATQEVLGLTPESVMQCPEHDAAFGPTELETLKGLTDRCPLVVTLSHKDK